jgi:hypothetical protein
MASAKGFDFICLPPNSTTVSWRIVEIQKAETSGVATLNLPAVTTLLEECAMQQWQYQYN